MAEPDLPLRRLRSSLSRVADPEVALESIKLSITLLLYFYHYREAAIWSLASGCVLKLTFLPRTVVVLCLTCCQMGWYLLFIKLFIKCASCFVYTFVRQCIALDRYDGMKLITCWRRESSISVLWELHLLPRLLCRKHLDQWSDRPLIGLRNALIYMLSVFISIIFTVQSYPTPSSTIKLCWQSIYND